MADVEKGAPPQYNTVYGSGDAQGYPPQQAGYPPQQQGYYPPQQAGYPPQQAGYYPSQQAGYSDYNAPAQGYSGFSDNDQDGLIQDGSFGDKSIRQGFIRKVYSILTIQFAITTIFVIFFTQSSSAKEWCKTPTAVGLMWGNLAVLLVTEITLICCEGVRRKHPINIILLGVFTVSMSFFVGIIASTYDSTAVALAAGCTAIIVLALTIFSFQTKWDITGKGGYLFVILICFMMFGFFSIFFYSEVLQLVYAILGVLIFSLFLVYDTQLLVGGGKYQLNEEEYVFGALTIYIDVIQIFLYLLEIFGRR